MYTRSGTIIHTWYFGVTLVCVNTAITDEPDIRQYILELKNLHTTQRVVTMTEPEEGAMSDRATTPDAVMEDTAELSRSRSRRYIVMATPHSHTTLQLSIYCMTSYFQQTCLSS